MDLPITFISLTSLSWQKQINTIQNKTIIYLTDFHTLKKNAKDTLIKIIEDKNWKAAIEFIPNMAARFLGMKVKK